MKTLLQKSYRLRQKCLRLESLEERLNLSTVPLTNLPLLSSNPEAPYTIHLDFDGHVVENTYWNSANFSGNVVQYDKIHSVPFDKDGDATSYSAEELALIETIWSWVADDFSMFNVNVTTVEPSVSELTAGGLAMRVMFSDRMDDPMLGTGAQWFRRDAIGAASPTAWTGLTSDPPMPSMFPIGVNNITAVSPWRQGGAYGDEPVWVFANEIDDVERIAKTATHEIGHGFGLLHDGFWDGDTSVTHTEHNLLYDEYYDGHQVANSSYYWGTHLGQTSGTKVMQWDDSSYTGARHGRVRASVWNGTSADQSYSWQDDVAIIAGEVGFAEDDHFGVATPLSVNGVELSASGVIEQRTDVDVFSVTVGVGEALTLAATPHTDGPSVNLKMDIYDATGTTLLATSSPDDSLATFFSGDLPAGDYLIEIDGVGEGDIPDQGYSDYGSLGMYKLSGSLSQQPLGVASAKVNYGHVVDKRILVRDIVNSIEIKFSNGTGGTFDVSDLTLLDALGTAVDLSTVNIAALPRSLTDAASNGYSIDLSLLGLSSGRYTLQIAGQGVAGPLGTLDGDADGVAGGDYVLEFEVYRTGDVNLDGWVDAYDLQIVYDNIGKTFPSDPVTAITWELGNLDGNLSIDGNDLSAWIAAAPAFLFGVNPFDGDFTRDGVVDGRDIDYLYRGIDGAFSSGYVEGTALDLYDLDSDGILGQSDIDWMLAFLGTTYGDADLDGDVDLIDLSIVGASFGQAGSGWSTGDFDGDGDVDIIDFGLLSDNYGYGT